MKKRLKQFPGYARVCWHPSHHLSPRVPDIPCSSKPLAPQPSPVFPTPLTHPVLPGDRRPLASDVLSAFSGALVSHAPVSLSWSPQNARAGARTLLVPSSAEAPALRRARSRPPRPLGNPRKARAAPASDPGRASMRTIRASKASHTCHHDV